MNMLKDLLLIKLNVFAFDFLPACNKLPKEIQSIGE